MRLKIIAVFSLIVIVLGALMFVVTMSTSAATVDPQRAPQAMEAAVVELEVEGMAAERWLATQVKDSSVREPFGVAEKMTEVRGRQATAVCDKIRAAALKAPELLGVQPDLIALVDTNGVVLGRDQVAQMRGENLAKTYPALKAALAAGTPMSDTWFEKSLNHQHLASFVPIVGDDGKPLGGIVFASLLNDARLSTTSEKTSGKPLVLVMKGGEVAAKSDQADQTMASVLAKGPAADAIAKSGGEALDVPGFPAGTSAKARGLEGYGEGGKQIMLVAVVAPPPANTSKVVLPILGITALGILLVVIAGYLLDAYIMRPVAEIEDGLLGIINGQTNRRFEIEHAELGGVVFRLNSLLNQLFGVTEDDTDAEGRPSTAPTGKSFKEAIAVDESMAESGASSADAGELHAEAEDAYYGRIYSEYIAAKKSIGDPTDHISRQEFSDRIKASEQEMAQKHGKPVRYKVELKGREVMLIAIPLT